MYNLHTLCLGGGGGGSGHAPQNHPLSCSRDLQLNAGKCDIPT